MMLTRMFRRRPQRDRTNPFRKFVQLLLDDAVRQSASAIVFGIPRDQPWDFDVQLKEEMAGYAEAEEALREPGEKPTPWGTDDSLLSLPNGASDIPIWLEIDGKLKLHGMSQSLNSYGYILSTIGESLIRIGSRGFRYIELSPDDSDARRRFVEVRQIMYPDNTVRLELLQVLEPNPKEIHDQAGAI